MAHVSLNGGDPAAQADEVHQAAGMVMVQLGVGIEVANERLRAYATAVDRPLLEVARDVVAKRVRLSPPAEDPAP